MGKHDVNLLTAVISTAGEAPRERTGKIEHGTPAFWQTNFALFAAGFATFALLYCVQPLMPLFSADFGVSAAGASLALSLTTGLLAVTMLVAGGLSEAWGRKPIMVASLLLSAVLTVICATVPHWPTLLVMRALMGIALSGLPAVAMAYVGEEMHPRSLGHAMGLYVGGTGLGGMAGRLLTGVITDVWGWRSAVLVIGLLGILSAAILWRCLPPSRHFVKRELRVAPLVRAFGTHLRDSILPLLFVEGFLLMGSFVTVYNYVGYRLVAAPFSLSQTKIGLIFAVYLFGIVSSAWAGSLSGKLGRRVVLPASLILMLVGTAITLSNQIWVIVFGVAVLTIGFFGTHSVASAWVGARAQVSKAQASSLYLFAYYLGSSVVGSLGGVFWNVRGWHGVVAMACALLLVAIGIALWLYRLPAREGLAVGGGVK
ncbi:MAG: MFS transporter [Pseudomonadota bacterium]|jgi:YNFM family putative membrane transporter|uniref:MFS transporter n=1 Tax=Burkholderiaceae TaxID=119060 RepID=UPI0010F484D4|nr:MFS transporter [Burkholderia sp. 4M9327F10]